MKLISYYIIQTNKRNKCMQGLDFILFDYNICIVSTK